MEKYTLEVTETGLKTGRYHYQVIDQDGTVISERRSNRKYVACTIDGQYYFGRFDLIGKASHGAQLKWCAEHNVTPKPVAKIKTQEEQPTEELPKGQDRNIAMVLEQLPQPKPHFSMTGYNITPIKLPRPIEIEHPTRGGKARIVSTAGFNTAGQRTYGVEYGPGFKFYESIVI